MLDGGKRRRLKELAHGLEPLIKIGKNGITDGAIGNIDRALGYHELIKVKFLGHRAEKKELSMEIAERTSSDLVDLIGNTAILYRENPDPTKRKIKP